MRRRDFIALIGGAVAWPLVARAQQNDRMRRIGVLMNGPERDPVMQHYLGAFEKQLRTLGWLEHANIQIDRRFTGGDPELTRRYAPELVALKPDAIFSLSSVNLAALQQATRSIPIVFALVSDPVAQGFVMSLAQPSGNITGFTAYEASTGGKWLALLKQLSPALSHVALLHNPKISLQSRQFLSAIEAAAPSVGVQVIGAPVHTTEEIEQAVAAVASQSNAGLIVPTDQFLSVHREMLVELVARHGVPTIYAQKEFSLAGGLIYYGTDQSEQVRKTAIYLDRILRGTNPGDLPVQNPTKFEFVINLKAARRLGIEIPLSLLLTADEVIE